MATRRRDSTLTVYDHAHRLARATAVAAFQFGQACSIGGEQLLCDPRWLDLAHDHVNGGYLGLACRRHNRAEGARRGNWRRGFLRHPERWAVPALPPSPVRASRDW
jgi:hypothetical protein